LRHTPQSSSGGLVSGGADFQGLAEGFHGKGDAVDFGGVAEVGEAIAEPCLFERLCILLERGNPNMTHQVKIAPPDKLNQEEVSEELVNDSLGEVTPADSTGLDSKDEARKREKAA
jgi:hypothetical protein